MKFNNKEIPLFSAILVLFLIVLSFYIFLLNRELESSNKYANQLALEITRLQRTIQKTEQEKSASINKYEYENPSKLTTIKYINFSTNYFDELYKVKYPNSLINIPESSYELIKCSKYIVEMSENSNSEGKKFLLGDRGKFYDDEPVIDYLNKNKELGMSITELIHCESGDRNIVIYNIPNGGGGGANTVHVGYLDSKLIEIPNDGHYGGPYWGCYELPLLFTNNEKLYFSCSSGDAGYSSHSIIEADLRNSKYKVRFSCQFSADIENNTGTTIDCIE